MSPADIFRDFRRNYNNCYVHVSFPDSYERHLFLIDGIDESHHPQIMLTSRKFGKLVLNVDSDYRIFFPTAISGVFQSGKDAYVALRQFGAGYTRGITAVNTRFSPATENFIVSPPRAQELLIEDMFSKHYLSLSEGLKLLENSDYRSVAVNRSFAASPSVVNRTGFTIFHRTRPIAEMAGMDKITSFHDKAFTKVLEGLCNDN